MRSPSPRRLLPLLVLAAACADGGPVTPGDPPVGELPVYASVNSPTIATLVMHVTADDLTDPLVFNFELVEGVATGTVRIPAGGDRTLGVSAYDVGDIQTHGGAVTIDIRPGANPPVIINLTPLKGDQPIEIILGDVEVVIDGPEEVLLEPGGTVQLTATVTDVGGEVLTVDAGWATTAPAVATVDDAGLVTGVSAGTAQIVATYAGVGDAVTVLVNPPLIAFTRTGEAGGIYAIGPDGTGEYLVTSPGTNPHWSPDGRRILYDRPFWDIYSVAADGSDVQAVNADPSTDTGVLPSPDGSRVAFRSDRSGTFQLHVMNVDGSGETQLTFGDEIPRGWVWSPDGTRIAFARVFEDLEVFVVEVATGEVVQLTESFGTDFPYDWSADGRILFASERDGGSAFYTMSADGTGVTQVGASGAAPVGNGDWSPDGSRILFTRSASGVVQLWLMNDDGSGEVQLTFDAGNKIQPDWSPDGTRIVYVNLNAEADRELWVVGANGTGLTRLTDNEVEDFLPDWRP